MSEASEDREYREFVGEVECPGCGRLLSAEDCDIVDDRYFCARCGAEIEEE